VDCSPWYVLFEWSWSRLFIGWLQMMRQGANSAVRFTTYSTLKQFCQGATRGGQELPTVVTFGIGGIAGLVTVYTTMPLE